MREDHIDSQSATRLFETTLSRADLALMVSLWPELSLTERKLKAPLILRDPQGLRQWVRAGVDEFGVEPDGRASRAAARDRCWLGLVEKTRVNSGRGNKDKTPYKVGNVSAAHWASVAAHLANPLATTRGPRGDDAHLVTATEAEVRFFQGPVCGVASAGFAGLAASGLCAPATAIAFGAVAAAAFGIRAALALRGSNRDALLLESSSSMVGNLARKAMATIEQTRNKRQLAAQQKEARRVAAPTDIFESLQRASVGAGPTPAEVHVSQSMEALVQKRKARRLQKEQAVKKASDPDILFEQHAASTLKTLAQSAQKAREALSGKPKNS